MDAARKTELHRHLKSIAAKGGAAGGRARMDLLTSRQRRLLAIRAQMAKLGDARVKLWVALCRYRGKDDYVVMGCSDNAERQFRQAHKAFPVGVEVTEIRTGLIRASSYMGFVEAMHAEAKSLASWPCRGLIQVCRGWSGYDKHTRPVHAQMQADWLTVRRPGRPRKDS